MSPELTKVLKLALKMRKDFPYYGPVIERVRINETDEVGTAYVSPNLEIRFNPLFLKMCLETNTARGLLLHEMLHYLFKHVYREKHSIRRGICTHEAHNVAKDMEINQYIPREELPSSGVFVEEFVKRDGTPFPRGLSYEQYLELLLQNYEDDLDSDSQMSMDGAPGQGQGEPQQGNGNGKGSKGNSKSGKPSLKDWMKKKGMKLMMDQPEPEDNEGDSDSNNSQEMTENRAIDSLIAECEEAEKKSGKQAGDNTSLAQQLMKVNKRPYKWSDIFKAMVLKRVSAIKAGYEAISYQRVNKRMMAQGGSIMFPGHIAYEHKLKLVVGMDVSGSMRSLTKKMYEVMKSIFDYADYDIDLTILECDTGISNVIENFKATTNNFQSACGGGTDMGAISVYVRDNKMDPDLIIIMTDNYTDWDPVLFKEKTIVMTNNVSEHCPYKQYYVFFDDMGKE